MILVSKAYDKQLYQKRFYRKCYCVNFPIFFKAPILQTVQKMKFSIKDFFGKYDQIHRKPRIWTHLVKKCLKENFIICAVVAPVNGC